MKSCNHCTNYEAGTFSCGSHGLHITDKTQATYCGHYIESRQLFAGVAQCCRCSNMNRYGYCYSRKKCFSEEERKAERKCAGFRYRAPAATPKKKRKRQSPKKPLPAQCARSSREVGL